MAVYCLNMFPLKHHPPVWVYSAGHGTNSKQLCRAEVKSIKACVATSPRNVNLFKPCSCACVPAALQVLSVTFELWAQLQERNKGLDRKWQPEMSPSWMARYLVPSLLCCYHHMCFYYSVNLCMWHGFRSVVVNCLTFNRYKILSSVKISCFLLPPFCVSYMLGLNGNWSFGQIVFIP